MALVWRSLLPSFTLLRRCRSVLREIPHSTNYKFYETHNKNIWKNNINEVSLRETRVCKKNEIQDNNNNKNQHPRALPPPLITHTHLSHRTEIKFNTTLVLALANTKNNGFI